MKSSTRQYWISQIVGWGGWMILNISFLFIFGQGYFQGERLKLFIGELIIAFVWYILATHLLRIVLHKISWQQLPMNRVVTVFILGVALTGGVSYYGSQATEQITGISLINYERQTALARAKTMEAESGLTGDYYKNESLSQDDDSSTYSRAREIRKKTGWYRTSTGVWKYRNNRLGSRFWWNVIFSFVLIALWLAIYMAWHYLQKSQQDKLDRLSLEKAVKELELKTIKSHINPHFIFNALNSIRALVDENPERARTAITELSSILRSSLQVEKLETVSLEKELKIVRDYLALEQLRFEERLKVNLDIAEDTLQQPIPPMMLQTLAENAVKHGISKQIHGGQLNIKTALKDDMFEIIIQNTGRLEDKREGFGIKSTRNRLRLLHNENASFQITNFGENMVQVIVKMPAKK